VKYFLWDGQWISYDDADTFKQKVEWANDIGFSGSLIWASDLDDYTFLAYSALLGHDLYRDPLTMTGALAPSMTWEVDQMDGEMGKTCYRNSACTILNE
jgi:chitinase